MTKEKEKEAVETKALTIKETYGVITKNVSSLKEIFDVNMDGEDTYPADMFNMVKVPSGGSKMWTLETLEGEDEVKEIKGIILHIGHERALYSGNFDDPDSSSIPICHSRDGIVGQGTAAKEFGGSCSTCPHSQFDRDPGVKKCSETKPVFVLLPGEGTLPTIIRATPGSFKNLKKYRLTLLKNDLKLFDVITSFALSKEKSTSNIDFSMINFAVSEKILDIDTKQMVNGYRKNIMPFINPAFSKEEETVVAAA